MINKFDNDKNDGDDYMDDQGELAVIYNDDDEKKKVLRNQHNLYNLSEGEDDEEDEEFDSMGSNMLDPSYLTPQQLQEQQRLKEEEEEARQYYEPVDLEKEGTYHVKDLAENTSKWRWKLTNVSKQRRAYSEVFEVGGYPWRILIFPHGNNTQQDIAKSHAQDAEKRFNAQESDWGFREFLPLVKFKNPEGGFIVDDTIVIEAVIHVSHDAYLLNPHNYDSKKETGFVGFKNQGATCYMNSLLQTLYHITHFRRAVYKMPIEREEKPESSIPLALQRVFHRLQYENGAVDTKELTKSFGWDTIDSFLQHDIQELARVLMDNLEMKMDKTPAKGTMKYLFEGSYKNYIKCINVDYESSHKDTYYDLQLNVKGCKDVYQSFEQYIEVETLEGENQYSAEKFGMQDAKKGCIFYSFPPILMLHLKRFEYDVQRDIMYKINDRYEFPLEIDLTKFIDPSSADYNKDNTYCLFSVLVHSGDVSGGHYYAFIKPYPDEEQWYKFDDEKVYKVRKGDAVDESFGGAEEKKSKYFWLHPQGNSLYKKFTNAYMLVYIRKSEIDTLLRRVEASDVPDHLRVRLEEEREEKERLKREKAESWKYCNVRVAKDDDLAANQESDLVSFHNVEPLRVRKDSTLNDLKELLYQRLGVAPERQRFWKWEKRQNKTNRPHSVLDASRESVPLDRIFSVASGDQNLYLEVSNTQANERPFEPVTQHDMFLFFKYYQPETRQLQYVGSRVFKSNQKIADLLPVMKSLIGLAQEANIDVYEEVRPTMIEPVNLTNTLLQSELQHGDILVFQNSLAAEDASRFEYPTIPDYYRYLVNRVEVSLCKLEDPENIVKVIELVKTKTYWQIAQEIADALQTEPQLIRLTGHNSYSTGSPIRSTPFKTTDIKTFKDIVSLSASSTEVRLYYEILDVPITDIENKKELNISWVNEKVEEAEKVKLLLPKDNTVADVKNALREKLGDKIEKDAQVRLLALHNHKIHKILPDDETVDRINYAYTYDLRAEVVPLDEQSMTREQRVVQVLHYCKDSLNIRTFGNPFFLVVSPADTVGQVKANIQKRIQVKDEEWNKYKFAPLVGVQRHDYLTEDDAVFLQVFEKQPTFNIDVCLGMEHKDPTPRQSARSWYDRPIVIKN